MTDTQAYRKKPVTIDAIQWTGENLHEVICFTDGRPDIKSDHAGMRWEEYKALVARDGLKIFTLEGVMNASPGDWIIRGIKGELYPCKPDIFELTYEPASARAPDPRIAELEAEVERLAVTVSAAEQRASQSEHRLHSFRRSRASTSKALSEFIKARAPELWPDYAAVSVNKSVYTDDYTQEPTWEREMNILLYRAEKAEEELVAARTALGASHDA